MTTHTHTHRDLEALITLNSGERRGKRVNKLRAAAGSFGAVQRGGVWSKGWLATFEGQMLNMQIAVIESSDFQFVL